MDSMITAAARSLAAGDFLDALNRIALRDDAPALALRGIAMAQLGDLESARGLVRRAARAFSPEEAVARARCIVAEAEIALASRDLGLPTERLAGARGTLEANGDRANAAHAEYLEVRHLLLTGRVEEGERRIADLDPGPLRPASRAAYEVVVAGIAVRQLRTGDASAALARAERAASLATIPSLTAEVERAWEVLRKPAARLVRHDAEELLLLEEVEQLLASGALVVDACRYTVCDVDTVVSIATRPVLFKLAHALAESWPDDVPRAELFERGFGAKFTNQSLRARLRVEIGRLRKVIREVSGVTATTRGFKLVPKRADEVVALARPVEEPHGDVLALLSDGESWSSSALALALGTSQRTVQRALRSLSERGKVEPIGQGRARRWMSPPIPGFTMTLLLPAPVPGA